MYYYQCQTHIQQSRISNDERISSVKVEEEDRGDQPVFSLFLNTLYLVSPYRLRQEEDVRLELFGIGYQFCPSLYVSRLSLCGISQQPRFPFWDGHIMIWMCGGEAVKDDVDDQCTKYSESNPKQRHSNDPFLGLDLLVEYSCKGDTHTPFFLVPWVID